MNFMVALEDKVIWVHPLGNMSVILQEKCGMCSLCLAGGARGKVTPVPQSVAKEVEKFVYSRTKAAWSFSL